MYIYLFNVNDYKADTIINLYINKFINKKYNFNKESVKQFNETILDFLSFLSIEMSDTTIIENYYYKLVIPSDVIIKNIYFKKYVDECIDKITKSGIKETISNYYFSIDNEHNKSKNLNPELHKDYKYPYKIVPDSLTPYIYDGIDNIAKYFQNNVLYIGPLREEPHLIYSDYIDNITDIGIKGEKCAAVLYHSSKKIIPYVNPFSEWKYSILEFRFNYLYDSVNQWLRYLEVADEVSVDFSSRHGYELKIKTLNNNKANSLTNVGVGVSQVLPIILSCLLASEKSTIIIEQPELHLHPAMQSKLAEFFITISQTGKQLIIETHSEHIINALRFYIAKSKYPNDKKIADDTQIYFVDKNEHGSIFKSIKIDKYAYVSDWPDGFFDEAQISNINTLKAITKKIEEHPDE